jgi:hypothetical protein
LFSLFALLDKDDRCKKLTKRIVRRRLQALWAGMNLPFPPDPMRADYYATLDIMVWAEKTRGPAFVEFLKNSRRYFSTEVVLPDQMVGAALVWKISRRRNSIHEVDRTGGICSHGRTQGRSDLYSCGP